MAQHRKKFSELFGCICGNANVNETKLRTLPVGDRFELIPFTFALLWNEMIRGKDQAINQLNYN